jgi:hypothetical protein
MPRPYTRFVLLLAGREARPAALAVGGVGAAATGDVGVNEMTIGFTSDVPERAMSWLGG